VAAANRAFVAQGFVGRGGGAGFFNGKIGEARVYSQPLSTSTIAFDYNLGMGGWATRKKKSIITRPIPANYYKPPRLNLNTKQKLVASTTLNNYARTTSEAKNPQRHNKLSGAWIPGLGDKFLTNREVIDKVLQGTFGVSGEIISRGLFMGDTPARWAAEGARAEQIARLTLGLKSRKDIELFKMFPEQQAKKIFLKRGLSEEKAQAKAEDIKRQLQEAGDDATLTMENMLVSAINNIKKYSDAASKESSMGNMANTIGRFAGVLNVPYLKIPVNAAWLAMNIRNPLLALSQSMIFGYDGIKNGNRASLRKKRIGCI
jgi:hypothetical protein